VKALDDLLALFGPEHFDLADFKGYGFHQIVGQQCQDLRSLILAHEHKEAGDLPKRGLLVGIGLADDFYEFGWVDPGL
jgi:hypothetical protein